MNIKEVNLENTFTTSSENQLKVFTECFENINKLIILKNKLEVNEQKFYVKLVNGSVKIGYLDNPEQEGNGFHNNVELKFDSETNLLFLNFVVFDGCRQWNLYEEIKMQGAPERNMTTKFSVPLENITYTYIFYIQKSE